ncbi:MAG: type II toxin-antitoxin system Phd/YefM family antitoxin [Gemmatimonadetes bacterium]|nr:type II toxin-antitoxin system Phd/YefM family antitoxin [Gemmatimonadota bacterium]
MDETVNIHYAKTHLSRLLARVREGDEITIAKAGTPVARLVSVTSGAARRAGGFSFDLGDEFFEPLPDAELGAWER